eukprot:jgi/Chrzof1/6058/Cz17g07060.t1
MLVLPCAGLTTATAAQVADYSQIVTGVNNVLAADLSSSAQVLTGDAFPVAYNQTGSILVSAAMYGTGRVVYFGHEQLVVDALSGVNSRGDTKQLVLNAAFWASRSTSRRPS